MGSRIIAVPGVRRVAAVLVALSVLSVPGRAAEPDALAISANIQALHLPHGTILDPTFVSPESDIVEKYTRGGDSAIWTGHYLAAEVYRFRISRSPDALANAWRALKGIKRLVDVTGTDTLARCVVPVEWENSVDKRAIVTEEAGHGVYTGSLKGVPQYWIGNTSRDQYLGVFFGLGVAYDLVDESLDPKMRKFSGKLVARLLGKLIRDKWLVRMPNGSVSTTFVGRVDQQLSLLQVGRLVSPPTFDPTYQKLRDKYARLVLVPITAEATEPHESYFKFNLAYISLFSLIRHEDPQSDAYDDYVRAYDILRAATREHGNAHFNTIDRALNGPDPFRDAETRYLLDDWLERSRRDEYVDLRGEYAACAADRACEPIAIRERVRTDFLWQRSPFLLYGGGSGTIETSGIDYILPYWMARYYSQDLKDE
jgi:hypothetical protein